jgi:hypothetical protein
LTWLRRLRTWLDTSGLEWWTSLVQREFAFLLERGYSLERVWLHQQGNFILYRGPEWKIAISYEPESTETIDLQFYPVHSPEGPVLSIDVVLRERFPGIELPPKEPLTEDIVTTNVRFWAQQVRILTAT